MKHILKHKTMSSVYDDKIVHQIIFWDDELMTVERVNIDEIKNKLKN